MGFYLHIRKEAEAGLVEAYEYYESCGDNLGADFILCVEESLSRISKNPNQYKIIHKDIRRALVKGLPETPGCI